MKVYLLLDRSGSMAGMWNEAISSVNVYVNGLPPDTAIYIAAFDSSSYDVIRDTTRDHWSDVTKFEVTPRNSTPLYDSVGRIAALAETENHSRAVIVVMTDGDENNSHEYSREAIDAKLNQLDQRGYQTIFLGAGFKDITFVGHKIGRKMDQTFNFASGKMLEGMQELSLQTSTYGSLGSSISYTAERRAYLDKSK